MRSLSQLISEMYLVLLVIALVFSFNVTILTAACNTLQTVPTINPTTSNSLDSSGSTTTTTSTTTNGQQSSSSDAPVALINGTFASRTTSGMTSNEQQQQQSQISMDELQKFRLEYNKYKILSHLSITGDLEEMSSPEIDRTLRDKLITTTAFNDSNNNNNLSNSRRKRSLSCDEVKSDKNACCLENFYVNFTHIGWDKWILYPTGYNANYCRGQCDLSHARYYHSTLLSKYSNLISLCCSPKQMAPLKLLYIDEESKVHQKSIPDMIVESCDCA